MIDDFKGFDRNVENVGSGCMYIIVIFMIIVISVIVF